MRAALEVGDCHEVLRTAHSLRGTLANLAARSAADFAAEIEQAGKSDDLIRAAAALQGLELELAKVIQALGTVCEAVIPCES
jgi:HPt (histidine-containing phosphotransfer) domain-containing protein